jgi:phosphotransferase system HPr (HPr) family protein
VEVEPDHANVHVRRAGSDARKVDRPVIRNGPRPTESLMSHETTVVRRQVEITNSLGLHLRPADKFVRLALKYRCEIRVHYNGGQFNGKSILDLATLAAECGTRLELEALGPDADAAVDALAGLVSAQFYENENGDFMPPASAPGPINPGRPSAGLTS